MSDLHVDLFRDDPLTMTSRFERRLPMDDPVLVRPGGGPTQVASGWATYYHVSAPHTLADCPFGPFTPSDPTKPEPGTADWAVVVVLTALFVVIVLMVAL